MQQFNFIVFIALLSITNSNVTYTSEEPDDYMHCPARKTSSPIPQAPGFRRSHKAFNFSENSAFQTPSAHKKITPSPTEKVTVALVKLQLRHPDECSDVYTSNTKSKAWLNPNLQSNSRPPLAHQFKKQSQQDLYTKSYTNSPELESQES